MSRRNEEVATLPENIAKLLALKGGDPFRIRAYEEAARSVGARSEDVEELHRAGRLEEIPRVGPSIAAKISEYRDSGRSGYYEELKRQIPVAAADLLEVPGIGPARAQLLHERLGISSLLELERAAREQKLRALPRFGPRLEERIAREAVRVAQRTRRLLLGVALPAAEEVAHLLRDQPAVQEVHPAGSIRRSRETIGDIDILVSSDEPAAVMDAFVGLPNVKEVLARGPTRASILSRDNLQIDCRVIRPLEYGSALQYFTGSKDHNIALRAVAMRRGWKLSEYGLFERRGRRVAGADEDEIYRALGLDPVPPELRENRGELEVAARHRLPRLVALEELRGDLHAHTDWSDGHDSAKRMVEAAIARGYEYLALTDHSRSLGVAGGLSVERLREQRRLIERLNERYAPFRVLHGAEIDILPNGELDYPDEVLAELDLVTVSVHGGFRQPPARMTARIARALRNPYVDILNHPTGRLLLRRPAHQADVEALIRVAAETGVALEIDGQPDRLDLDDHWARRATAAGALLVCNSDAHGARQLEYARYAVTTARRGWVEARSVLNTWPLRRLLAHLRRRRPARAA